MNDVEQSTSPMSTAIKVITTGVGIMAVVFVYLMIREPEFWPAVVIIAGVVLGCYMTAPRAYVRSARSEDYVLVETDEAKVLISPKDPAAFVSMTNG